LPGEVEARSGRKVLCGSTCGIEVAGAKFVLDPEKGKQMGYWKMENDKALILITDKQEKATGTWGDYPADIMDEAVSRIVEIFIEEVGQKPTKAEIVGGLMFHLNARDDLADK
jgi:hypothetical protein